MWKMILMNNVPSFFPEKNAHKASSKASLPAREEA
jgi:hypothetical protein